jgi:hypothetical protein
MSFIAARFRDFANHPLAFRVAKGDAASLTCGKRVWPSTRKRRASSDEASARNSAWLRRGDWPRAGIASR